jgi:hypothetical protein
MCHFWIGFFCGFSAHVRCRSTRAQSSKTRWPYFLYYLPCIVVWGLWQTVDLWPDIRLHLTLYVAWACSTKMSMTRTTSSILNSSRLAITILCSIRASSSWVQSTDVLRRASLCCQPTVRLIFAFLFLRMRFLFFSWLNCPPVLYRQFPTGMASLNKGTPCPTTIWLEASWKLS